MPRRRRPPRAGALSDLQPLKIAAQIAALQVLFYLTALILFLFTALVAGVPFGLDLILGWQRVRGDTTQGWVMGFVWLLDGGLCMALAIVALIGRSKLVPDFAITIQALHLLFTTLYSRGLPQSSMWYASLVGSAALCASLGIWGCQYRELQPVFFGGGRILGNNPPPRGTISSDGGDDEEMRLVGKQSGEHGGTEEYEMGKVGR
ncbi:integral membrane protein S linking to the trans Golgi network-domain-containing protein [Emericellopsis atlantica]|uniref:Integral membrane protein S linking to the trans Golgi network-domain-containing protein n=1 Tax=Emericellopsis atlantica TaxID=2614577 RepID=A0A9P8CMX8_9HYPO|nr:integral membrane protein S linking to the trans Golgi network-domain-containing protein [Emericellopsis atlantica]KAG9251161.1 integral membrane protein S linking to the trans Golgi network-domain-containing protein [Emericellopsis atlantica]